MPTEKDKDRKELSEEQLEGIAGGGVGPDEEGSTCPKEDLHRLPKKPPRPGAETD